MVTYPQEAIQVGIDSFEEVFVNGFPKSNSRSLIFEKYLSYIDAFKQEIMPEFRQWVDGSFVTKKMNPKDIDIVTFIPFDVYEKRRKEIDAKFIMEGAIKQYGRGVDAHAIKVYPTSHELYPATNSDTAYWWHQFSKTKYTQAKKRYPKGLIELNFEK